MNKMLINTNGSILILVHGDNKDDSPDDKEWNKLLEAIRKEPTKKSLVLTFDNTPNPKQRSRVEKEYKKAGANPKTVVITDSAWSRGVALVFSWLGANIEALSPGYLNTALDVLEISNTEKEVIRVKIRQMAEELCVSEEAINRFLTPKEKSDGNPFEEQIRT